MYKILNNCSKFLILSLMILSSTLVAQSKSASFGNAYIPEGGFITVFGAHDFLAGGQGLLPGVLSTKRGSNCGTLNFVNTSGWVNANENQYVDGFVKIYSEKAFTFPIGNMGFYKPIAITGGYATEAAYVLDNPIDIFGNQVSTDVLNVSNSEFWKINGENSTKIILTWDETSELNNIVGDDLSKLSILGWNGSEWELIPSAVEPLKLRIDASTAEYSTEYSSIESGSIQTLIDIVPNTYSAFTFGKTNTIGLVSEEDDTLFLPHTSIAIKAYPNPVSSFEELQLAYNMADFTGGVLEIIDPLGNKVYEQKITDDQNVINIPSVSENSGLYIIGIRSKEGASSYQQVLILE